PHRTTAGRLMCVARAFKRGTTPPMFNRVTTKATTGASTCGIPSICIAQAFLEIHLRAITESLAGPPEIGHRFPNVARPAWGIAYIERTTNRGSNLVDQVKDRCRTAAGHVHRKGMRPGPERLEVCRHYVSDMGEVTPLPAVAINSHRRPLHRLRDEARDDGRILGRGILPRAKNVEVPQCYRPDAAFARMRQTDLLSHKLCIAIR